MECAIAISGSIGSGKSTISEHLAAVLGRPHVSFPREVRSAAEARQIPMERGRLQRLGEEMIADGWPHFCGRVLDQASGHSKPPVIEGVRHLEAIQVLRDSLSPIDLQIVFLEVREETRQSRLAERGLAPNEIEAAQSHSSELELPLIRDHADLVISTDAPVDVVVVLIVSLLGQEVQPTSA